jgi:two-component system sensor histidine kinase CreC
VEQHGWLQKRERIALAPLLQAAADAVAMRAQAADVAVGIEVADGLEIQGDAYLLRQALNNLLENALAFSSPGSRVQLGASREGDGVVLRVADRGSGVPEYALERVFERFYSLARPATGQRSSGLGLSFVQEVARLHGGRASLRNREGGGAIASLHIRFK